MTFRKKFKINEIDEIIFSAPDNYVIHNNNNMWLFNNAAIGVTLKEKTEITDNILNDIIKVCQKYNIRIESLAGTLEEYILNDNDGYMGYSKCDDCKHKFETK